MSDETPQRPRGTPPSAKELNRDLGGRKALWEAVLAMVKEFGATWKWMHSETTWTWGYRAYLPGDRFFVGLSIVEGGLEASLNLKADEWDGVVGEGAAVRAALDALREQALASGDDPAWLHVKLTGEADLPVLAQVLVARGRRVQPPRRQKRR